MNNELLNSLRLQGYSPRNMLDIGANVGDFSVEFASIFTECKPTLLEPNRYCHPRLRKLPFEFFPVAASRENGKALFFLTKEWLKSTGASLYREKTNFFRDEVLLKEEVTTVRLDDLFSDRTFDFIKIDVQGAELDVLVGGAALFKRAEYVLIEISLIEYNEGGATAESLFQILNSYGFKCHSPTEFHRLRSVMDGALFQIDFLFEKKHRRRTQNFRYAASHDRTDLVRFLSGQKERHDAFSVIEIGDTSMTEGAGIIDACFRTSSDKKKTAIFQGRLDDFAAWDNILAHVDRNGKFSYSVCSHSLSGINHPGLVLEMLPRISKAGFIAVPSKFAELMRHSGPYRGYVQHRWIFCLQNTDLILVPKIPLVEYLNIKDEKPEEHVDRMELQIHWRGSPVFSSIHNDYIGSLGNIVHDYTKVLS